MSASKEQKRDKKRARTQGYGSVAVEKVDRCPSFFFLLSSEEESDRLQYSINNFRHRRTDNHRFFPQPLLLLLAALASSCPLVGGGAHHRRHCRCPVQGKTFSPLSRLAWSLLVSFSFSPSSSLPHSSLHLSISPSLLPLSLHSLHNPGRIPN